MKKIRIAYSICGEGHGHYGRNIEIIKSLSKKLPDCEINLYIYGDTLDIFNKDEKLPGNVQINIIPGWRFYYKKSGVKDSMISTFTNLENIKLTARLLKMDFLQTSIFPIKRLISKIFNKPDFIQNRYFMKFFKEFDFAIADLEPILPRIADVKRKPFMTLDNQHSMLFCGIDTKKFNFKERFELLFYKNMLKIYHPFSDLAVLTCFFSLPIKKKYSKFVKEVGPIIREDIIKMKDEVEYNDYILIYAHKFISDKLFPMLTELKNYKFVIFTNDDDAFKNPKYNNTWMELHRIDPVKFVDYLVKCKAVISTGGNTLISEAVYLKKPFFAISLEGNFEQRLNLYMLDLSCWGEGCKISELKTDHIKNFLNKIDDHIIQLKESEINNNTEKLVNLIVDKMNRDLNI
jgi:uncharacterized protein (TIGR00661 family)